MFYRHLEDFGDSPAVIEASGRKMTYRQLAEAADVFAASMSRQSKRLVFVLCSNNLESLVGYLGTLRSGHAAVLLAADTDPGLLANLSELYHPDYVWRPGSDCPKPVHTFMNYALDDDCQQGDRDIYSELVLLLSTSGSTGSPKMVRLTASNIDSNAASIAEYLKLSAIERPITSLPMHYSFGLSVINSHLRVGSTILLTDESIVTRPFWNFFKTEGATSLSGVPYSYEMLKRFKFCDMHLPSLRTITQAGGKLTPKYALEFAEYAHQNAVDFYIMYGQTEATARISYLPPQNCRQKYRSVGIPIPGGKLSIIDNYGNSVTTSGIDGQLVYTGPNVMLGYAESEVDLAKGNELHGTLKTGDIAQFDADGFFYVTGRLKRFVKIFGNRVNLDEVEHFLKAAGLTCACGGRDDLLRVAITDLGRTKEVASLMARRYGFHHSAIEVVEVADIPKNSSGKIQYQQLFREGERWRS